MIRNFFVDFVVVCALSLVVWGSAPMVVALCTCTDEGTPICKVTEHVNEETSQPYFDCTHYGWCGTRYVWQWGWYGIVPYLYWTEVDCACGFYNIARNRCECQPAANG